MAKTPRGTAVGVEDPYEHAGVCDRCTDDGRCRFAFDQFGADPEFGRERRDEEYVCPVVAAPGDTEFDWEWADCPHYRDTADDRECARCGLTERRMAHDDERPLLEEHHLSYAAGDAEAADGGADAAATAETASGGDDEADVAVGHEITAYLCRWCHATVHDSWGAIDDDVSPDQEAIAARERRRSREQDELGFDTARERREDER
jgi:hypothetical protein